MTLQTRDLILVGLGNVHRQLLRLLDTRADTLAHRYGLHLRVVGACDSGGVVIDDSGLNVRKLLAHKEAGNTVGDFPGGRSGATALDVLSQLCADAAHPPDALLEASPVNLTNAEPALSFVRAALQQGVDVVLANKAPLALRFSELQRLADQHGTRLAFSATVCGGLPVVNVGTRDLVASRIKRVQGIFNSTSNYILSEMAKGDSFEQALAEAQRRGIAEADPSLDVDGWDTANKLTIVANAVLGYPSTVRDVQPVTGIREAQGNEYGPEWKLVGTADLLDSGGYRLSVQPLQLPPEHKLAHVNGWEMGVLFESDLFESIFIAIDERGPTGTAAAMLRDVVNLYRHNSYSSKDVNHVRQF